MVPGNPCRGLYDPVVIQRLRTCPTGRGGDRAHPIGPSRLGRVSSVCDSSAHSRADSDLGRAGARATRTTAVKTNRSFLPVPLRLFVASRAVVLEPTLRVGFGGMARDGRALRFVVRPYTAKMKSPHGIRASTGGAATDRRSVCVALVMVSVLALACSSGGGDQPAGQATQEPVAIIQAAA